MSTPVTTPEQSFAFKACSGALCFAVVCFLGTFPWLVSFILLTGVALMAWMVGWSLPWWVLGLSFVVGLPLGAWLELRGVKH